MLSAQTVYECDLADSDFVVVFEIDNAKPWAVYAALRNPVDDEPRTPLVDRFDTFRQATNRVVHMIEEMAQHYVAEGTVQDDSLPSDTG